MGRSTHLEFLDDWLLEDLGRLGPFVRLRLDAQLLEEDAEVNLRRAAVGSGGARGVRDHRSAQSFLSGESSRSSVLFAGDFRFRLDGGEWDEREEWPGSKFEWNNDSDDDSL